MSLHTLQQMADAANAAEQGAHAMQSLARSRGQSRVSLSGGIRFMVFLIANALAIALGVSLLLGRGTGLVLGPIVIFFGFVASIILLRMIHVGAQWEQGVVLRLGKFVGSRGPGLIIIFPLIDYLKLIDTRVQTIEIPRQKVITRDNVPVSVNGVLYFKVSDVQKAVTVIQDYEFAILQYAMAALRDVIGRLTLDEMLAERDQIQKEIEVAIEKSATSWGLKVDSVRLQDIDMPEELKRMMSRQASAEREKRATITKAEGDKLAALNLAEAAATMFNSPGAMQLRSLQSLDGLGASPSNTVVLAMPSDFFQVMHRMASGQPVLMTAPAANPSPVPPAPAGTEAESPAPGAAPQ